MKPDEKTLRHMYWDEKMTQGEIANRFGCSNSTIGNWMKEYRIERRDTKAAQRAFTPDKDTLCNLYVVRKLSCADIAKFFGHTDGIRIWRLLKRYGVPIRPPNECGLGKQIGKRKSKEHHQLLSEIAKKRVGQKSPRYGVKLTTETKIKIKDSLKGRFRGEDNPNYKPDADRKYRVTWSSRYEYKEWRNSVYKRDNYVCQLCGKPSDGDIECHHIKTVKTRPDLIVDVNNGITLCIKCHRSIKGKESAYEQEFQNKVNHLPTQPHRNLAS